MDEVVNAVEAGEVQSAAIEQPTLADHQAAAEGSWYEGHELGEGVEFNAKDKEYASLSDYVKATQNLRTMKGLVKPGEDASDDEKAAFRESLGDEYALNDVPAADAYDVKALADNAALTDDRRADIGTDFNAAGLTNEQANSVMEIFAKQSEIDAGMVGEYNAENRKESEAIFKEQWGADFKDRLAGVDLAAEKHPDLFAKLEKVGLAGDKDVIAAFDAMARANSEDSFTPTPSTSNSSPKETLAEFMQSKEFKAVTHAMSGMSAGNPRYDAAIAKRDRLVEATIQ